MRIARDRMSVIDMLGKPAYAGHASDMKDRERKGRDEKRSMMEMLCIVALAEHEIILIFPNTECHCKVKIK